MLKNLVIASVAVFSGLFLVQSVSAEPPERPQAAVIVDLTKPLPAKVDLKVGQNLVFQGVSPTVTVTASDGNGKLVTEKNKSDTQIVFEGLREGKGQASIVAKVKVTNANETVVKSLTIQLNVDKPLVFPKEHCTAPGGPNVDKPLVFPKEHCTAAGGINGKVVRDVVSPLPNHPAKPVVIEKATVIVRDKRGVEFARVKTDKTGNFTVDVPPGDYTLEAIHPKGADQPSNVTSKVNVKIGAYSKLDVHFKASTLHVPPSRP